MTDAWEQWKKGFYAWESATASYLEGVMKNPAVLGPAGQILANAMKARAAGEQALAQFWGGWGLPTKKDQERALHALNQIQSTLIDLEERLATLEAPAPVVQAAEPAAKRTAKAETKTTEIEKG